MGSRIYLIRGRIVSVADSRVSARDCWQEADVGGLDVWVDDESGVEAAAATEIEEEEVCVSSGVVGSDGAGGQPAAWDLDKDFFRCINSLSLSFKLWKQNKEIKCFFLGFPHFRWHLNCSPLAQSPRCCLSPAGESVGGSSWGTGASERSARSPLSRSRCKIRKNSRRFRYPQNSETCGTGRKKIYDEHEFLLSSLCGWSLNKVEHLLKTS